jgi:hypothetical protein
MSIGCRFYAALSLSILLHAQSLDDTAIPKKGTHSVRGLTGKRETEQDYKRRDELAVSRLIA